MYTPAAAAKLLQVSKETLRLWHHEGKIRATTTDGGHRRYIIDTEGRGTSSEKRSFIYARVSSASSAKQEGDLQRQIDFLQAKYPDHEVISDIGSGLNFKRRGLCTILELLCKGVVKEVVVAHRDRLVRFGFELLDFIFKQHRAVLKVSEDKVIKEPVEDLKDDLLAIITVFTARYYGSRKYRKPIDLNIKRVRVLPKNKILPKQRAKSAIQ